jgi:hypothetical protein
MTIVMRRHTLIALVALGCVVGAALLLLPRRLGRERVLPAPQHLPATARALLKLKMARHGDDLSELTWAVLRLDFDEARMLADRIGSEPRLARPTEQDATELNSSLPPDFFRLQDELRNYTMRVGAAAARHDPDALAASFGDLSRACVRCHQIYLNEPAR